MHPADLKHTCILILGGGFAGAYTALHRDRMFKRDASVDVTLGSAEKFLLFVPRHLTLCGGDTLPSGTKNRDLKLKH
jgi:NADH dehydrogenase FAD-containing subunit